MINSQQIRCSTSKVNIFSKNVREASKIANPRPKLSGKRKHLYMLQTTAKKFLKGIKNRISHCLSSPINKNEGVYIASNADQRVKYKNLQLCASRWACSVCAEKLIEVSRQEILKASNTHLASGGSFIFLTLTTPHNLKDKLKFLVKFQALALKKFFEHSRVKSLLKSLGYIGRVRSFEIKHGKNGWHPHYHFLIYIDKMLSKDNVKLYQLELLKLWQKCCLSAGSRKPNHHGLDFKSCTDPLKASKYVVKDSFELTYSNTKGSKVDSINPFDMLVLDNYDYGNLKDLFVEYYKATKGKSLIQWSKGLKKRFAINNLTDEQIIKDELEEYNIPVVVIPKWDWEEIKLRGLRANLLDFTEKYLKDNNLIVIEDYVAFMEYFYYYVQIK